ncbi:hypothetical protein ACFL1E_00185 [Candidatus Omnitrophota bacterium]
MSKMTMNVSVKKIPEDPNIFEFTIATPVLRSQFRLPRPQVNKLRILIEKALISK